MLERMRIGVVEASPAIHAAIASLLDGELDLELVRHARSLAEFAARCDRSIDILLVDLRVCFGQDRNVLQGLRGRYPGLRLVVMTSFQGREYEDAAAELAADGWVLKTQLANELVRTLRQIASVCRP